MKYFDLIYDECSRINEILDKRIPDSYFISASLTNIIYGVDSDTIIFDYDPNRYEYAKTMILKDLIIRLENDTNRQYPLKEIVSFMQNDCKSFTDNYKTLSLKQLLDNYNLFNELVKNHSEWEDKYKKYLKEKYPW